ncbi:hypothetical protein HOK51_10100 [Candidatus Woesearchaeota archaeon]|jgi:hypothetical protein|nr:hypothetical protein [Candidatus Woesearchaeota archaeon]MBT6520176.1 hypothetical protein [Candidatus Woesearchaeota archaeon]MBT7367198.1 hypothetical protein [Candidatus Woesearchaeota archaeon]
MKLPNLNLRNLNNKRGQGLSLNIVIIAVIVLIILIVLVLIFSGKLKLFNKGVTDSSKTYTSGKMCELPGTNNVCGMSADTCQSNGGSYHEGEWMCEDGGEAPECCMM